MMPKKKKRGTVRWLNGDGMNFCLEHCIGVVGAKRKRHMIFGYPNIETFFIKSPLVPFLVCWTESMAAYPKNRL